MRFFFAWVATFLLALASALFSFAFAVQNQSLNDYVEHAINTNPEAQASFHRFKAAILDVDVAKSGYLPSLDLNGRSEYVDRNYGDDRSYASHQAEVSLSQMLYDGFQTEAEVERFEQIQKVRYFELLSTLESIALQTVTAYLDVLLQRELLALAEDNLRSHVDVFKQIEEGVIAGITRRADLEQISGRLSLSESNVLTEQANLHDVSARFIRLTGLHPATQLQAVEASALIDLLRLEDFLLSAYSNNPGLKASVFNIDAQKFETESAKSNYHPKVDLVASYGTQSRDERGLNNTITEGRIGVQVSFNLFRGGADKASIASSLENLNFAKDLRDKACRDVRQVVQISFNNISNLERQLISLNSHRLSSDRVKTAYFDQFNIGQRTLLDLLDSENEFYESSRAYIVASYSLKEAHFTLLNGLGRVTELLGLQRQGLTEQSEYSTSKEYNAEYICPPTPQDEMRQQDDILQRDLDKDAVIDLWDDCPDTPEEKVTTVNDFGCAEDVDFGDPFAENFDEQQSLPVTSPATEPPFTEDVQVLGAVTLKIPFTANSSKIRDSNKADLDGLLTLLINQPTSSVIIHGHASLKGPAAYNQKLSELRAQEVAKILVQQGNIDIARITAVGYGEKRPLVNVEDEDANAINRRIEVYVVKINE